MPVDMVSYVFFYCLILVVVGDKSQEMYLFVWFFITVSDFCTLFMLR
jgi:hypothetical protein